MAEKNNNIDNSQTDFASELESFVMNESDMISSKNTPLEDSISNVIKSTKEAGAASRISTGIEADRGIRARTEAFADQKDTLLESQRGFATKSAAFNQLEERTERTLKDMELRKQQLLAEGDARTASQIGALQMKELEFQQQAKQQHFTNMLNLSAQDIQRTAQTQAQEQFSQSLLFDQKQHQFKVDSQIASIALEYDLSVDSGETLDSIISKTKGKTTREQRATLAAQASKTNRETTAMDFSVDLQSLITDPENPVGAFTAARAIATAMDDSGVKVDEELFSDIMIQATKIANAWEISQSKATAEAEGKTEQTFRRFFDIKSIGSTGFTSGQLSNILGSSFPSASDLGTTMFNQVSEENQDKSKLNLGDLNFGDSSNQSILSNPNGFIFNFGV